jgi:hypothetical protein
MLSKKNKKKCQYFFGNQKGNDTFAFQSKKQ